MLRGHVGVRPFLHQASRQALDALLSLATGASLKRAWLTLILGIGLSTPVLAQWTPGSRPPTAAEYSKIIDGISAAQRAIDQMQQGASRNRAQACLNAFKQANSPGPLPAPQQGPQESRVRVDPALSGGAGTCPERVDGDGTSVNTEGVGVGAECVYLDDEDLAHVSPEQLAGTIVHEGSRLLQVSNAPAANFANWPNAKKCEFLKNELAAWTVDRDVIAALLPLVKEADREWYVGRLRWLDAGIAKYKGSLRQLGC